MEQPKGSFCQSCGIPIERIDCFGTYEGGLINNEYCIHCYENGKFTDPEITMDEMIDLIVDITVDKTKISEEQARQISQSFIPTLKRWRK